MLSLTQAESLDSKEATSRRAPRDMRQFWNVVTLCSGIPRGSIMLGFMIFHADINWHLRNSGATDFGSCFTLFSASSLWAVRTGFKLDGGWSRKQLGYSCARTGDPMFRRDPMTFPSLGRDCNTK